MTFTPEDHLKNFSEFITNVSYAGGATPHLSMVVEAARRTGSIDKALWMAGCYALTYNYAAAEIVWNTWTPETIFSKEFEEWVEVNWRGLPLRKERKAVLVKTNYVECIRSYVKWINSTPTYWDNYRELWQSFTNGVKYMGRYIAIRYIEFRRRLMQEEVLVMPDIRPRDGKYPRQSIALMYPQYEKSLLGGNNPDELEECNEAAALCKFDLQSKYDVSIDYYTLQSLSCEYKQSVLGKKQFPGKSLDSELKYWNKVYSHFESEKSKSIMFDVRKKLFPNFVLGELQGWESREELGKVLVDYGYTWSDYLYDYTKTLDLSKPIERIHNEN